MGTLYQPAPRDDESHSRPLIIAVVLIIVVAAIVLIVARKMRPTPQAEVAEAPYASNLRVSDLHLSTAQNFVGGEVTYLEGKIANTGTSTLTTARIQCIFRDTLGQVVDSQTVPLQVEVTTLGQTEYIPLDRSPLQPNQQRSFRLIFEHISADWNMGLPEMRVVTATIK